LHRYNHACTNFDTYGRIDQDGTLDHLLSPEPSDTAGSSAFSPPLARDRRAFCSNRPGGKWLITAISMAARSAAAHAASWVDMEPDWNSPGRMALHVVHSHDPSDKRSAIRRILPLPRVPVP
jgi:hypothetical protein